MSSEARRNRRKALRVLDKAAERFFDNRDYSPENIGLFAEKYLGIKKREKDAN